MYDLIASQYSQFFPCDPGRLALVRRWLAPGSGRILDIGSASGDFVLALAAAGYQAEGWEPDDSLYSLAAQRAAAVAVATVAAVTTDPAGLVALRPLFRQAGLLDLTETAAYDLITCLGNTLPHLRDSIQVADFCVRAARALRPGGRLLLQLMNYDRLVGQPSFAFPDIETDRVVFSRRYTSITNQAADFHIRLLDKATGAGQAASSRLYPIRRSTLASSLAATGFHTVSFCRDYSLTVADGSEPHYLVWAELTV